MGRVIWITVFGIVFTLAFAGIAVAMSDSDGAGAPVTNVAEDLQGQAAGVNITNNSGAPGAGTQIRIRGGSSINAGSQPLVVIDGMPGDLQYLDPSMIESMEVLKDAASAAIYGAQAGNGVILITTNAGAAGNAALDNATADAATSDATATGNANLPVLAAIGALGVLAVAFCYVKLR